MTAGWAATNTLREAVRSLAVWESVHGVEESPEWEQRQAALALVEAALDAAEALNDSLGNPADEAYGSGTYTNGGSYVSKVRLTALAAALRAVREGK